jgi:predicted branched-subunit amino acid permease
MRAQTLTVRDRGVHRRAFLAGVRAMGPWLTGTVPFGLVIGVSAAEADIPTFAGWLTAPMIFAGSAQVAAIEMLDGGAAAIAVIVTATVINLRLIIYSAAMASYWRGTPLWWRLVGGYLLVDPSFSVGVERYQRDGDRSLGHVHYLGGALTLWTTWLVAVAVGAATGTALPDWLGLHLLVPLYLVGIIVPGLRQPSVRRATLTAAVVAAATFSLPMHLGLAVAIVAGVGFALLTATNRPTAGEGRDR